MSQPTPDLLDLHLRKAIAIIGAVLSLIGWYHYLA